MNEPVSEPATLVATINERVRSLDRDYQDLSKSFGNLESRVEAQHTAVLSKIDSIVTSLNTKLESRSITPWPTIWGGMSVMVAILIALGTAFYVPIQRDIDRQSSMNEALRLRSYTDNARIAKIEQAVEDHEKRYNNLSQRVIAIANSLGKIP